MIPPMNWRIIGRRIAVAAGLVACGWAMMLHAANIEPRIIPTVHAALEPTSAIQVPLRLSARRTSVWRSDTEQRMLLSGGVEVAVGYRTLKADEAAVWLTPSREAGERTYDVAIYLSGNVEVREGNAVNSTRTIGKELLVTTRITQAVQLEGEPVSRAEEDSPLVKRGNEIRNEIASRPMAPLVLPQTFISTTERALQAGWIARGPNNMIIPGPGDIQITRDSEGNVVTLPAAQKAPKTSPTIILVGDPDQEQIVRMEGKELIAVLRGVYAHYDFQDGKPPLDFRAHRVVAFGMVDDNKPAATASGPATRAATQPAAPLNENSLKRVTGLYLEGDVTLDQGDKVMVRAERMYFDLTSQRAIMLDATLSTVDELRHVPVYMRAAEIRQLSRGEFAAKKASFSTSEFFTPHYHIGASEVYLRDVTPTFESMGMGGRGGEVGIGQAAADAGFSGDISAKTFQYQIKDATLNAEGVPIFYWPFLGGDTAKNEIPLRTFRVSNSETYGLTLLTDWDLFGLFGQPEPQGVRADLNLDYFGKRGPAGGVQSSWQTDTDHGILRSYAILDQGTDRLGKDRDDVSFEDELRGRVTVRNQRDLGDGWTLQLEGSYISDPTFLEQFFQREFDTDKEHETAAYLKKQGQTDALTLLVSGNLMDFTSTADQVDDQFMTEKLPEVKYWRIGDSLLDIFTYYSENGISSVQSSITNFTPTDLDLLPGFVSLPASAVPANQTYRAFYQSLGWTTGNVLRADSRHELSMPVQVGDAKITPYVTGRVTWWDTEFPDGSGDGSTVRVWGGAGVRTSMQFWRVYTDAESQFFDVHQIRHVVEPQFNIFVGGADEDRRDLQPFERGVEGISGASGTQLSLRQKWQTKRGGEGHWRDVDWIVLNVTWNQFWNRDETGVFYPASPLRGYYFASRPELSLATNSIDVDGVWRIGERMRFLGEANYSIDGRRVEQAAAGFAVDQTNTLSYFLGGRYVNALNTAQWTVAMDYQITQKYRLIASESFDTEEGRNILTSVTFIRRMPRLNAALTVTYDANQGDTSVVFTMWPEGFPAPSNYATERTRQ